MASNSRGVEAGKQEPVVKVASRLRMFEDYNLASRLQDQEFGQHYALNRAERQLVGNDTKQSRREQANEDKTAVILRQQQLDAIAANDERLAAEIQRKLEQEERLHKQRVAQLDADFARNLELRERRKYEERRKASIEAADEQYARDLQEYYNARSARHGQQQHRREAPPKKPSLLPSFISRPKKHQQTPNTQRPHAATTTTTPTPRDSTRELDIWTDSVDERTQNELNLQMATAASVPLPYCDPPPAYSSLDHSTPYNPNRDFPLATIATRDSSSPPYPERFPDGYPFPSPAADRDTQRTVRFQSPEVTPRSPRVSISGMTPVLPPSVLQEVSQAVSSNSTDGPTSVACRGPVIPQRNQSVSLPKLVNLPTASYSSTTDASCLPDGNNNTAAVRCPAQISDSHGGDLLDRLHPTNPFFADIAGAQAGTVAGSESEDNFPPPPPPPPPANLHRQVGFIYNDEFGLPPPSAFAMGTSTN